MKFFLVGMPGCGKSTFGRRLSKSTGYKLIDLDIEIVSYAGKTISDIFESEGEERFREIESGLLKNLTRENDDFMVTKPRKVFDTGIHARSHRNIVNLI